MLCDKSMSLKLENIILKTQRVVGTPCLCLPVAAAVGDRFLPANSAGDCSMGLWPLFPRGGTGAYSDGMPLSLSAETMLVFFLRKIERGAGSRP